MQPGTGRACVDRDVGRGPPSEPRTQVVAPYITLFRETVRGLADGRPELGDEAKEEALRRPNAFVGNRHLEAFARYSLDPVAAGLVGLHRPA